MRYNPFKDYDKYGCLKLPWALYLALAFLLRSYVIWIVALSNRQDTDSLLSLFYPNRSDFTMALVVALPALLCGVIISVRRVEMPRVGQISWRYIRPLVALAASVQLSYVLWLGHLSWHNLKHLSSTYPMVIEMVALCAIILYCAVNQRFKDVSGEFPIEE